jgi:hypothetical protein
VRIVWENTVTYTLSRRCVAIPFFWLGALFTSPMILAIQTTALGQLIVQTLKQNFEIGAAAAQAIQWSSGLMALGNP